MTEYNIPFTSAQLTELRHVGLTPKIASKHLPILEKCRQIVESTFKYGGPFQVEEFWFHYGLFVSDFIQVIELAQWYDPIRDMLKDKNYHKLSQYFNKLYELLFCERY